MEQHRAYRIRTDSLPQAGLSEQRSKQQSLHSLKNEGSVT
jgi:hypothetical protein